MQNIMNIEKDYKVLNDWARSGFSQASLGKDYYDIFQTMDSKFVKKEHKHTDSKTDHTQI